MVWVAGARALALAPGARVTALVKASELIVAVAA
jgi:molybdopterin-binding protein